MPLPDEKMPDLSYFQKALDELKKNKPEFAKNLFSKGNEANALMEAMQLKSERKYYWVSYMFKSKFMTDPKEWHYDSVCCLAHPFSTIRAFNYEECLLLSWKEITKTEYDLWQIKESEK